MTFVTRRTIAGGLGAVLLAAACSPAPDYVFPRRAEKLTRVDQAGRTWHAACDGCPELVITIWDDGHVWLRSGRKGPDARVLHGRWVVRDSASGAETLALHAGDDAPMFVMEARADTVRLLEPDSSWRRVFSAPLALARAPQLDLIEDETRFEGIWDGNVHAMAEWTECGSGHSMTVDGGATSAARRGDGVLVLHGRYRHEIAPARTFEWGGPAEQPPRLQLRHAFVADSVVGRRARATCPRGRP